MLNKIQFLPLTVVVACGWVTEQECDECVEDARYHAACHESVSGPCWKDVSLEPCICTAEMVDLYPNRCETIGDVMNIWQDDEDIVQLLDEPVYSACYSSYEHMWDNIDNGVCSSFFDYYSSCRSVKNARKASLNFRNEREYYGECRRWFWDANSESEMNIENRVCQFNSDE